MEAGKAAKTFVRTLLAGKQITVFTRWASALGSSRTGRFYAIAEVDGHNLADSLVENGLARLHGTKVTMPDGTKSAQYLSHLAELETSAREKKLGAWSHSVAVISNPVIEEVTELITPPRWLERAGFTVLGGAGVGFAWGLSIRRRSRRQAHGN